jgi:hypothetical protein
LYPFFLTTAQRCQGGAHRLFHPTFACVAMAVVLLRTPLSCGLPIVPIGTTGAQIASHVLLVAPRHCAAADFRQFGLTPSLRRSPLISEVIVEFQQTLLQAFVGIIERGAASRN